jgi:hypothetical protein
MTREDIGCIIKWFSHIEQLATDGKTANGFQMPTDKILATIKVVAKDSREYIEKFCNEFVPKDLEEAVRKYQEGVPVDTTIHYCGADEDVYFANHIVDSFIAGAIWGAERFAKIVRANLTKIDKSV